MASSAQIELWQAEKVATQVAIAQAPNGIHYAMWGETRISDADLERLVGAVPSTLSAALEHRAYYFVPLAIADTDDTMVAPGYTVDLGDRAICHRNAVFGSTEAVFLSTRLVEDRFGLAFEFFINVAHNFVEAAGVPESFSTLVWQQAEAQVRGETSQDAWETRRRAQDVRNPESRAGQKSIDERSRSAYFESAFSDALAIYHAVAGRGLRLPRPARARLSAAGRPGPRRAPPPRSHPLPRQPGLRVPGALPAQRVIADIQSLGARSHRCASR